LPHEWRRAAGVGDAMTRAKVVDERDWGESGKERLGGNGTPTGGPSNIVPGQRFKWYFKQILNSNVLNKFQIVSNFGRIEKYFPGLWKIEIKYGFEDLREVNSFLYRRFLRFGMDLE
jgi:hypothetical protein